MSHSCQRFRESLEVPLETCKTQKVRQCMTSPIVVMNSCDISRILVIVTMSSPSPWPSSSSSPSLASGCCKGYCNAGYYKDYYCNPPSILTPNPRSLASETPRKALNLSLSSRFTTCVSSAPKLCRELFFCGVGGG